jgi:hypothetical protein
MMYADDLHLAMFNRRTELKYLKSLLVDLMPIITPKFIYECRASRHFLRELTVGQILINGIDAACQPHTMNRLIHLYFTTALQRRQPSPSSIAPLDLNPSSAPTLVELLAHFCAMNGSLHKRQLVLEMTDVMYEKELMNQFSRVLDRQGSLGLLSIYLSMSDVLNEMPLASDIFVRKKIHQRLKHIDERYLNPNHPETYLAISNPYDPEDTLVSDIKKLIYHDLAASIDENEQQEKKSLDIQHIFPLLSRFHCKIYELVEEKYQRCFLTSDEHFLYICGQRMDSSEYRLRERK